MKKRIFAAVMALCLMAGTSAIAQQTKGDMQRQQWTPEQIAQKKTDRMTQELNLTQEQATQMYDYNLQQVKKMSDKRDKMHVDRKAEAEKMKSMLTPEQYEKWNQMRDKKGMMKGKEGEKSCCTDSKTSDMAAPMKEKK